MPEKTVLQVDRLCKSFGGVHALRDLSFTIAEGEILGLIGPNGSGKSTTVNVLAGVYPETSGDIRLQGENIGSFPEYKRVSRGLARTFQTASIFPEFTVRDQILLGASVFRQNNKRADINQIITQKTDHILQITGLHESADAKVSTISSAEQRFLMIATALASQPKLLLLDEPAAGLVQHERKILGDLIRQIRADGVAVLVIEHHMGLIMDICDRIVVLNFGARIAEGTPKQIRTDQAVIDAYLGESV